LYFYVEKDYISLITIPKIMDIPHKTSHFSFFIQQSTKKALIRFLTVHYNSTLQEHTINKKALTAILLVRGFSGFGLHTLLSIVRNFPGVYKNFVFVSVAEIDSGTFKGIAEIAALKKSVEENLIKYVKITCQHGFTADYITNLGADVIGTVTDLIEAVVK
jgi:hypothetical protein